MVGRRDRMKERLWVLRQKRAYVRNVWQAAENQSRGVNYLTSGLQTLWMLTRGHPDQYVPLEEIAIAEPTVAPSPSGGLYAWLDEFDGRLGAGIVERQPNVQQPRYRIKAEFRGAVDDLMKTLAPGP